MLLTPLLTERPIADTSSSATEQGTFYGAHKPAAQSNPDARAARAVSLQRWSLSSVRRARMRGPQARSGDWRPVGPNSITLGRISIAAEVEQSCCLWRRSRGPHARIAQ